MGRDDLTAIMKAKYLWRRNPKKKIFFKGRKMSNPPADCPCSALVMLRGEFLLFNLPPPPPPKE